MALEMVYWLQRTKFAGHVYFDTFPRSIYGMIFSLIFLWMASICLNLSVIFDIFIDFLVDGLRSAAFASI